MQALAIVQRMDEESCQVLSIVEQNPELFYLDCVFESVDDNIQSASNLIDATGVWHHDQVCDGVLKVEN